MRKSGPAACLHVRYVDLSGARSTDFKNLERDIPPMTAGAKTFCRPARTALILSMAARMGVDIAPRAIFGKPEKPDLRALEAGWGWAPAR